MKTILLFGAFDPLHEGHLNFFQQARELGVCLIVVVARDKTILSHKKRQPFQDENTRLKAVKSCGLISDARLGNLGGDRYKILEELEYEIIALGYDQEPSDEVLARELKKRGKENIKIVRLKPYHPDKYKSSRFRA